MFGVAASASAQELTPAFVGRLVVNERPGTKDATGWGADILSALSDNQLTLNRENVCSVVAVASQESGMVANPQVPGLGKIAYEALKKKIEDKVPLVGGKALAYLDSVPSSGHSFLKRIRAARTERDLDLAYRDLVKYFATRSALDGVLSSGALDKYVEDYNQINTIGSMQVSVAYALELERGDSWRPFSHAETEAIRDRLYTRRGGLYYGARQLLDYPSGYSQKIFRFADYNAGRYSARNAAFQDMVARLTQTELARDGDMLSYDKRGEAQSATTKSEEALRDLMRRHNTGLNDQAIRRDLLREKKADFPQTATFQAVRGLYTRLNHQEPAFARLPGIELKSVKIKSRMTTAIFAERVGKRYAKCMTFGASAPPRPAGLAPPRRGREPWFWEPEFWRD